MQAQTPEFNEARARAEAGDAEAQYTIGFTYDMGVPQDNAEAVRWYRLAADQGFARAQYRLGTMYLRGFGVPQDDAEGVRWYRLAADQGEWMAQQALQEMYVEGRVVPLDELEPALREFVVSESERRARERLEPIPPPPPPPPPPLSRPGTSTNIRRLQSNGAFCCVSAFFRSRLAPFKSCWSRESWMTAG